MSGMIDWIAAEAEREEPTTEDTLRLRSAEAAEHGEPWNTHFWQNRPEVGHPGGVVQPEQVEDASASELSWEEERERRIYRRRTVRMLQRYMRYSIETGRLPSVLGREFFRAPVTPYSCVTFEDRVIFVHDMETCLDKLDEFSREIIARHVLQEHDQEATGRLLGCGGRTVRRYIPMVLDLLSEILLDVGLMERAFPIEEKSCQEGEGGENLLSNSEERKNKFQNLAG